MRELPRSLRVPLSPPNGLNLRRFARTRPMYVNTTTLRYVSYVNRRSRCTTIPDLEHTIDMHIPRHNSRISMFKAEEPGESTEIRGSLGIGPRRETYAEKG